MNRAGWLAAPLCVAVAIAWATEPARADLQPAAFEAGPALAASQAAIGRQLPSLTLTDQHGQALPLADFRGRALVVSPIYTSCYHICPTTTTWLKRASDVASAVLDESAFAVLTVGFDTAIDLLTVSTTSDQVRLNGPVMLNSAVRIDTDPTADTATGGGQILFTVFATIDSQATGVPAATEANALTLQAGISNVSFNGNIGAATATSASTSPPPRSPPARASRR